MSHLHDALAAANTAKSYLQLALSDAGAVESLILLPMISDMADTCGRIESLISAKREDAK